MVGWREPEPGDYSAMRVLRCYNSLRDVASSRRARFRSYRSEITRRQRGILQTPRTAKRYRSAGSNSPKTNLEASLRRGVNVFDRWFGFFYDGTR